MMMLRLKRLRNSLSEVPGMVLEEAGCCDSRTEQSPPLSTTVGAIRPAETAESIWERNSVKY